MTSYEPVADGQPDPGEVVWAWVPYEEDPSQGKDRPVLLIGHTEGITHLDPKRDGRYLLSNCKDQTARLWDIRKVPVSRTCTLHLPQCLWDIRKVPAPCTCTLPSLNASGTSARWRSLASAPCTPSMHAFSPHCDWRGLMLDVQSSDLPRAVV